MKGSNRMLGYLGQPERTAEVLHDGWYITGDIAAIDDEGFIRITDRLSRFSKIARRDGAAPAHRRGHRQRAGRCALRGDGGCRRAARRAAGGAVRRTRWTPAELWQRLADTDLPRLWIPKRENLYQVESLPQLGTGKLDLRGIEMLRGRVVAAERPSPRRDGRFIYGYLSSSA